jgi:glycerol uptake facilitator-like aquaporin
LLLTRGMKDLRRALLAEFVGTALLLCAVIGSGIMAERLSAGNMGVALLANTLATVFILYVLIDLLGPVSGAHLNPVVSVVLAATGRLGANQQWQLAGLFIAAQLAGAVLGAALANAMFDLPLIHVSNKLRAGPGQWLAEAVAAAGLIVVVLRAQQAKAAALVACYIGAAYWFTASTSFANPAAVLGRMFSDTFAGIAPAGAAAFVAAQFVGGAAGAGLSRLLGPVPAESN